MVEQSSATELEGRDRPRVNVLGVGVHPLTMAQALATIDRWITAGRKRYVCLAPVHNVLNCVRDQDLRTVFNRSGLTTPDGMPLVWICRARGYPHTERVYGPDLMAALCRHSAQTGYTQYFYGGEAGVAQETARVLEERYAGLRVAGAHAPPFGELSEQQRNDELARLNRARPDIVWVAIGSPRQERWMAAHLDRVDTKVMIGVGAAFDFITGRKPQAPRWMQRTGLEWLFRLAAEPRRLWRRYLEYPRFVVLLTLQALGLKRYELD